MPIFLSPFGIIKKAKVVKHTHIAKYNALETKYNNNNNKV